MSDTDTAIERLQTKTVDSTLSFCIKVLKIVDTKEQAIEILEKEMSAPPLDKDKP